MAPKSNKHKLKGNPLNRPKYKPERNRRKIFKSLAVPVSLAGVFLFLIAGGVGGGILNGGVSIWANVEEPASDAKVAALIPDGDYYFTVDAPWVLGKSPVLTKMQGNIGLHKNACQVDMILDTKNPTTGEEKVVEIQQGPSGFAYFRELNGSLKPTTDWKDIRLNSSAYDVIPVELWPLWSVGVLSHEISYQGICQILQLSRYTHLDKTGKNIIYDDAKYRQEIQYQVSAFYADILNRLSYSGNKFDSTITRLVSKSLPKDGVGLHPSQLGPITYLKNDKANTFTLHWTTKNKALDTSLTFGKGTKDFTNPDPSTNKDLASLIIANPRLLN
jgi:hypothetical protein